MVETKTAVEKNEGEYLNGLTGLRGLASFLVVFSHVPAFGFGYWMPGFSSYLGSVGVMLFFSLSGFLMGYLYCYRPCDVKSVVRYGIARFSRIAPAYLVAISACIFIYHYIDADFPVQISSDLALRHFLFMGNQSVFWSIPPEVQFYAMFIIFWFAFCCLIAKSSLSPILFFIGVSILLIMYRDGFPGTFVGSHLALFLFGTLFGVLRVKMGSLKNLGYGLIILQALVVLFGLLIMVVYLDTAKSDLMPLERFRSEIAFALLASFVVAVFSIPTRFSNVLFGNLLMQKLGLWSFSLYLTHMPILYFSQKFFGYFDPVLNSIIAIAFSILFAAIYYHIVEKPGIAKIKKALEYALINGLLPKFEFLIKRRFAFGGQG